MCTVWWTTTHTHSLYTVVCAHRGLIQYTINVIDPPKITRNPISQTKYCKQGTVLTVRASGPGTISYQWLKDNMTLTDNTLPNCTGARSDSLRFISLLPEHTGSYKCRVSNNGQGVESKPAELKGNCVYNIVGPGT